MHGIWPHHGLLPQCKGLDWRPDGDKRTPFETHPSKGTKIWDPGLDSKNIMPVKASKSNNHASWALNFSTWSRLSVWFDTAWCDRGRRVEAANDIWRQHILWRSAHWKSLWQQAATRKKDEKVTMMSSHPFHESAHCKIWPKQIGQTHKTQLMLPKPFCGPHVLPDSWAVSRKQEWWIAALAASSSSNTFENSRRGRKVGR